MNRNHIWKKAYKEWLIEQSINRVDVMQAWKPSPVREAVSDQPGLVRTNLKRPKRRKR